MRLFFLLFFIFSYLFADNIGILLKKIENNDDLSLKTKKESSGISYVLTRYQLEMMQVKTLADILKNTIIGYSLSRYGIVDPVRSPLIPYNSFGIKVFIDNQEISSGNYDNSLYLLSKIDLSFVDHVEIYYMSPSYSLTNEPAYVIIKLYTKSPQRDEGLRLESDYGTFKTNAQIIDYANNNKKFSYYFHFSNLNLRDKKYKINQNSLSRNSNTKHFLYKMNFRNTEFLLTGITYNQDAFLGLSLDGNIKKSNLSTKLLHFGIDKKINAYNIVYTFDYIKNNSNFIANDGDFLTINLKEKKLIFDVNTEDEEYVHSIKIRRNIQYKKNNVIYGLGYRYKSINNYKVKINSENESYILDKYLNIINTFFENNYQYKKNQVFTAGASFSKYYNKSGNFLKQYKLGYTYLYNKNNVFKLFYNHIEFLTASYLYNLFFKTDNQKPRKNNVIIGKYKKYINNDSIEIAALVGKSKNIVYMSEKGMVVLNRYIPIKILDLKYHKNYFYVNDLIFEFNRMYFKDIGLEHKDRIIILNTHRYKKFDFFENIVYLRNKFYDKSKEGIDLSLGIKYNVNDNLTIGLKGNNLLNKRYKDSYILVDVFKNNYRLYDITSIQRELIFSLEYMF